MVENVQWKFHDKMLKHFFGYDFLNVFLPIFIFATMFFIYEIIEHASVTPASYYTEINY